jgi:hypothetical protein
MDCRAGFQPVLKVVLVYVVFMLMYGVYRFFPVFPLSIICATNESNFQHYKAVFFAFIIVDLIELLVYRLSVARDARFWNSRLLAAAFVPWLVFLLWYLAPAVHGRWPSEALEIIYANIITILAFIGAVILEGSFTQLADSRALRTVVWTLTLVSIVLYMTFTFSHLPWADVFVEPQWR